MTFQLCSTSKGYAWFHKLIINCGFKAVAKEYNLIHFKPESLSIMYKSVCGMHIVEH